MCVAVILESEHGAALVEVLLHALEIAAADHEGDVTQAGGFRLPLR